MRSRSSSDSRAFPPTHRYGFGIMPVASSRSTMLWSLAIAVIAFALLGLASPAHSAGAEGEGWDSFNESDGCDAARVRAPRAAASGWFSNSVPVRGPWGDYFGRTIGAVDDALVWWDVPIFNFPGDDARVGMSRAIDKLGNGSRSISGHQ